ncbi:hypothetical protein KAR26_00205 [Candidatus Parcubacteria bacterium]|nr:hypothetical protein [Candidatus Parcubacteria bacterium]
MKVINIIVLLLLISIALLAGGYANREIQEINEKIEKINAWMHEIEEETRRTDRKIEEVNKQIENTNEKIRETNRKMNETDERMKREIEEVKKEIKKMEEKEKEIQLSEIEERTVVSRTKLKELSKKIGVETIETTDAYYFSVTMDEIKEIIADDPTNEMEYKKNIRDCEDFSVVLAGQFNKNYNPHPAIGIVSGICKRNNTITYHSWNSVLIANEDGSYEVYYVLPQTDRILKPEEYKRVKNCTAKKIVWY